MFCSAMCLECAFLQRGKLFVERAKVSDDMLVPSRARGSVGTKVQRRRRRSVKWEKEAKSLLAGDVLLMLSYQKLVCGGC